MKKILTTTLIIVALAACQKSEPTPEVSGTSEVVFTSGISTRVTGTAWDEGDQIGVFMYSNGATAVSGSNALYATDAGNNGTYSSTDPLLYPSVGSVDFIAYHPYTTAVNDGVVSLYTTDQSTAEELKVHDFMVAAVQGCSDSDVPDLTFNRKMSKIAISVEFKETKENATLSDVSLSNVVVDGTFAISNADGARTSASIVAGSTTSDISLFYDEDNSVIEGIIIPQTVSSSALMLYIDGVLNAVTIPATFEEGKQHNYQLAVGEDKVELAAGTITEWDEQETVDMETTLVLSYVEFKRNESATANMTKSDEKGTIESLLSKFRRCLMTTDGNGNATICYLDNSNSTLYNDGTTAAALDGTEGDVMVYFPEFWYNYENVDNDYFRYYFSEVEIEGFVRVESSLVGAYKAYNENDMVYSLSGVSPTNTVSQANFKSYAAARGTGYQIIDYEQHCTIAMMLYARYLDRNTQNTLGTGAEEAYPTFYTGTTNYLGNNDGVEKWVNGLGVEGVYGGVSEWIDGVEVNNYVWTITNPSDNNSTRTVTSCYSSNSYITAMAIEDGMYFDMVPTAANDSYGNYYADYYHSSKSTTGNVVYRSYFGYFDGCGVSYVNVNNDSSYALQSIGSRLAFRGTITEATSVEDYKGLFSTDNE